MTKDADGRSLRSSFSLLKVIQLTLPARCAPCPRTAPFTGFLATSNKGLVEHQRQQRRLIDFTVATAVYEHSFLTAAHKGHLIGHNRQKQNIGIKRQICHVQN